MRSLRIWSCADLDGTDKSVPYEYGAAQILDGTDKCVPYEYGAAQI